MVRVHATTRSQLIVVCTDSASVPVGAKVLAGVETEGSGNTGRANEPALALCEMGLGAVFDYGYVVASCVLLQHVHLSGLAVEMNRDDRLGSRAGSLHDLGNVDIVKLVDVDEHH